MRGLSFVASGVCKLCKAGSGRCEIRNCRLSLELCEDLGSELFTDLLPMKTLMKIPDWHFPEHSFTLRSSLFRAGNPAG